VVRQVYKYLGKGGLRGVKAVNAKHEILRFASALSSVCFVAARSAATKQILGVLNQCAHRAISGLIEYCLRVGYLDDLCDTAPADSLPLIG
jgi:hypothetical protein